MPIDWYPRREAERRLFLQNFVDTIADATTLLKQPAGTYKEAAEAAQAELDLVGLRDAAQKALDTAQRNLSAQETLTSTAVRAGVKQIKNTMNVPAEVLDLLELTTTPAKPAERVAAEAPVLKVKMDGIHPSIQCVKRGFDAVQIWCCRTGEKDFSLLATVTHLPYFDNRPNGEPAVAEQRDYFAYYLKRNEVASAQGPTYTLLVPGGSHA
ncbi:hypothetical protein ACFST9_15130 [Hymenobacter monticola]|uniref:Uncharacterized protein n=1 Tax=Hymenobacter monticola TaxID=1705399 RepID=A0ABY4B0Q8_9BACT|nr:hypothetical protein [Hymenobacter monticola]UOE32751.1 hypothetical protein MTP16_16645 [Hymenobacter monticola]